MSKRRINVLMDELKENRKKLGGQLAEHETQYVELQTVFHGTDGTRGIAKSVERMEGISGWYRCSMRAWDTYRRSEEARMHMQRYNE